jgi:RNA polymerase II-associated factor 1
VPKVIAPVPAATRQEIIENTFLAANLPLASLQHPSKKNLVAMDSWELLPDVDLWPSNLQLIRFGEDPGEEKTVGVSHFPVFHRLTFN